MSGAERQPCSILVEFQEIGEVCVAKLWLHIGSHKTGTTSTQKTLAGSRDVLRKAGLVYPWNREWFAEDPRAEPRGYAQHYLTDEAKAGTLHENLDKYHRGFEGKEWMMSSEVLSTMRRRHVEYLLETFSQRFDDIHALMYVREPGSLAISRTATHIVMGKTTLEAVIADPKVYRYRHNIEPWLDLLGKDKLTVKVYERKRLKNENMVDDVLGEFGYDAKRIALTRATMGITPSHAAILALSERNGRGEGHVRGGPWRRLKGPPFTLPPEILEFVRRESADDVAWLREQFGIEFPEPALAR